MIHGHLDVKLNYILGMWLFTVSYQDKESCTTLFNKAQLFEKHNITGYIIYIYIYIHIEH